jgi:hypothetical protein
MRKKDIHELAFEIPIKIKKFHQKGKEPTLKTKR